MKMGAWHIANVERKATTENSDNENVEKISTNLFTFNDSQGRGLFATRDYSENDVLFEERPLVSCQFLWNTLYKYAACDHCMRPLESAEENVQRLTNNPGLSLPCPECCTVEKSNHVVCPHCQIGYCRAECRDQAWAQYHKTLCINPQAHGPEHPLIRLQEAWRNMHYPPETANIMLLARMIATVRQAADKPAVVSKFSQFCKATVNEEEEIAHKLLGQQFQSQQALLRELMTEALFEDDVQQWFTPEGFRSMFALIGTNGQGIGTSPLSVWVQKCEDLEVPEEEKEKLDELIDKLYDDIDKVSGQFMNSEGSGLYSLQSTCNHSCVPNAEVTFPHNNFTLVVKAMSDIKAGEEIHISYLDECALERSRHSRQKILKENYLFTCSCEKCISEADDPDLTSEEEEMDDDD